MLIYCVFNLIIVFQAFTEICRQILQTMSENNQVGTQFGGRINERWTLITESKHINLEQIIFATNYLFFGIGALKCLKFWNENVKLTWISGGLGWGGGRKSNLKKICHGDAWIFPRETHSTLQCLELKKRSFYQKVFHWPNNIQ